MKAITFNRTGLLSLLLIFSFTANAGNNSGNDNVKSNDVVLSANIIVEDQTQSLALFSSVNNAVVTSASADTVSAYNNSENLYGYRALEYSGCNLNYDLPYRLFVPEDYQEGEKYPLVIFLHGAGRRGSDNVSQIKDMTGALAFVKSEVQEKHPSFVLAPQCPKTENWVGKSYSGARLAKSLEDIKPSSANLMLKGLVKEILDKYDIDSDRIYLTGQSMGGISTWYFALTHPNKFAAIAPVCGRSFPSEASVIADMPVWAFHGAEDKTITPEGSREMVKALEKAGNTKVKYTEYPNVGHDSWVQAYTQDADNNGEVDIVEWIFSQKRE
ncbi:carboxylesterase family protein [Marinilabilia rubra]|uniref:Phospholipase n=1 Tax=Marinilabilia rubra TaxID=2162893 RepID=A0A2U2B7E6_9BACT|nr:alpha/beta hydrolase-fold protein [Marinilabilia rubra]PWD98963.1 phospholipase [Marinilabilia rubra]